MPALRHGLIRLLVLASMLVPATAAAQSASISIEFALTSGLPVAGSNLDFTVTANNEGPSDALNTSVSFDVPTNSTFVSRTVAAGWSCSTLAPGATGTVTCTIPSFGPGSASFVLTVATLPTTPQGTPVTITGSITATTTDPDLNDNTGGLTVLLIWQSNLAVTKSGPASAFTGTPLVYTISITNPGPSNAADLVVTDTFAAPLRFVSLTAPGWTCLTPSVGSPGTVSCSNPEIPVGVTTLTLRLDTSPSTVPTSVTNDVSVSASSDPAGTRVASATTAITASADLTIAKAAAPPTPVAGQTLTYTITITQNGPSDAADVTVTDPLPSRLLFQSISAPGWGCATPPVGSSGGTASCTRTPLAPGVYTITVVGLVSASTPAGTAISNTASVTSTTPDPTVPNTATASVTASTQADLSIAKSAAPPALIAGQALTYTITVTQTGPSDAVNVTVADSLPSAVLFQSITASGWSCATPTVGSSGTVSCTRTPLAAGVYTITVAGLVSASTPAGTAISNTASVTSTTPDPTVPNTATVSGTASTQADLSVTITDAPDPVAILGTLTYQVVVTNGGPSDAVNPSLSVPLDPTLRFESITSPGGWTCTTPAVGAAGTVACHATSLAKAASAAFTIVASVRVPPDLVSRAISTSATTAASVTDPNPADNTASATTAIVAGNAIPTLSDLAFVAMAAMLLAVAVLTLRAGRSARI